MGVGAPNFRASIWRKRKIRVTRDASKTTTPIR
jgi:hypothetical protein